MKKSVFVSLLLFVAAGFVSTAHAVTDADVDLAFSPYKGGFPSFPGLSAGTVVNKNNVDQFKEVLDPANYQMIKEGWYEATVNPTIDFPNAKGYVEATRKNAAKVKLGAKNGEIEGYVAGRRPARWREARMEFQVRHQLGRQRGHLPVLLALPQCEHGTGGAHDQV